MSLDYRLYFRRYNGASKYFPHQNYLVGPKFIRAADFGAAYGIALNMLTALRSVDPDSTFEVYKIEATYSHFAPGDIDGDTFPAPGEDRKTKDDAEED